MIKSISLTAPAKINPYLHVIGRRADGYHELDLLFVPLALADQLTIRAQPSAGPSTIICRCPGFPALEGPHNLATRAAERYLQWSSQQAQVEITIQKRIWVAAGMGGGSSDAATVIRGLSTLLPPPVPDLPLARLALELGADVPFFLNPRPVRARGIGEVITALPIFPSLDLVLVNPGQPLSTAAVFRQLDRTPRPGPSQPAMLETPLTTLEDLLPLLKNDLQPAAEQLLPQIRELEQILRRVGARGISMTGSGPTLFGLFASPAAAQQGATQLQAWPHLASLVTSSLGIAAGE